ncbi:OJ1402_H07.3 [Oryza sativa (japonica cultivar-group)]
MASCAARAAAAADSSLGISRLRPCGWESEAGDGVGALERASGNRRRGQPRRSAATSPRGSVRTERGQASVDVKQARTGAIEKKKGKKNKNITEKPPTPSSPPNPTTGRRRIPSAVATTAGFIHDHRRRHHRRQRKKRGDGGSCRCQIRKRAPRPVRHAMCDEASPYLERRKLKALVPHTHTAELLSLAFFPSSDPDPASREGASARGRNGENECRVCTGAIQSQPQLPPSPAQVRQSVTPHHYAALCSRRASAHAQHAPSESRTGVNSLDTSPSIGDRVIDVRDTGAAIGSVFLGDRELFFTTATDTSRLTRRSPAVDARIMALDETTVTGFNGGFMHMHEHARCQLGSCTTLGIKRVRQRSRTAGRAVVRQIHATTAEFSVAAAIDPLVEFERG